MQLQDLSEDEIRTIFSFCDICAVVSMSRTNKYLRRLTLHKLVWVDLVDNLRRKGFVDRLSLSDIQAYSQEALVDLVKRILTGPACWNPPAKPKSNWLWSTLSSHRLTESVLQITPRSSVLHPSGIRMSRRREVKLLDGGEYVLFYNINLECWSVRHDKLVWAYDKNGPDSSVYHFDGEIVDGGDNVNIIISERGFVLPSGVASFIRIIKLNFATGRSTTLFQHELSDTGAHTLLDVKICGPLAFTLIQEWTSHSDLQDSCILANWQTQSHVKFASMTLKSPLLVTLIPNHVLLLTDNASGVPEIRVIHTAAFSSRWRLVGSDQVLDTINISEFETVVCENITFGQCERFQRPWTRQLSAYGSPLDEGTYRVWISLAGSYPDRPSWVRGKVICSYRLSLPKSAGHPVIWQQRTADTAVPQETALTPNGSDITYSGHRQLYRDRYTVFAPGNPPHLAKFDAADGSVYSHLSTYSGALTYFSVSNENIIRVLYFE
ncbi:hypothetical protein C8F04DRAFT_1108772, partial [Mycena alexandri]